jgi:hypothetical protein
MALLLRSLDRRAARVRWHRVSSCGLLEPPPPRRRATSLLAPCPSPSTLAEAPPEPTDSLEPLPEWLEPLVWKPKRRGKLHRFVAQMVVQLLVVNTLPPELQVATFVLAASPSWSLSRPEPIQPPKPAERPEEAPRARSVPANPTCSGISESRSRIAKVMRSDILIYGTTAIVSSWTGTESDEGSGLATLIDLTDPANARVIGTLTGVGSRLALGPGSILFSTDRTFLKGTPPDLDGVQSAALGYVTIITAVQQNPALLALDRKTIESQTIKCRAIFPRDKIQSSELQILRDRQPAMTMQVTLDEDGRGMTQLPAGFEHPLGQTVEAELIVNRATPQDQPASRPKRLNAETFEILPEEAAETATDDEPYPVAAVNQALLSRLVSSDGPRDVPVLTWRAGTSGGAFMAPRAQAPRLGLYVSNFQATGVGIFQPELLTVDGQVLARSAPITVLPGLARHIEDVQLGVPEQSPYGPPGFIPADGTTQITVVAGRILDGLVGNVVPDGTSVSWALDSTTGSGELVEAELATTNGYAAARYRAGTEPGEVRITVRVGRVASSVIVRQADLRVRVIEQPAGSYSFRAVVESDAGLPAEQTPITWGTEYGLVKWGEEIGQPDGLRGGVAIAEWNELAIPTEVPYRYTHVFAQVGRARHGAAVLLPRYRFATGLRLETDHYRLAANGSEVRIGDGTLESPTVVIPSRTSARTHWWDSGSHDLPSFRLDPAPECPASRPVPSRRCSARPRGAAL